MEIEIRPGAFSMVLAVSAIVVLAAVGYQASPRDAVGRPVLLLPDVRAVELYRRDVVHWVAEWQAIDEDLTQIMATTDTDLLSRSRKAQRAFDRAVVLAQDVDGTESPPALLGLQELSVANSNGYIEAGAAITRWLSAPSDENWIAAEEALSRASAALATLGGNEWIMPAVTNGLQ